MTDTISRQAVIEAIASVLSKGERPFSPVEPLLIAINAIPSQPTQSDALVEVLKEVTCYDDEITFKMEIRSKNDD